MDKFPRRKDTPITRPRRLKAPPQIQTRALSTPGTTIAPSAPLEPIFEVHTAPIGAEKWQALKKVVQYQHGLLYNETPTVQTREITPIVPQRRLEAVPIDAHVLFAYPALTRQLTLGATPMPTPVEMKAVSPRMLSPQPPSPLDLNAKP